jgi:phosphopantetheinyl transferase (holo-ACP synthase)
MTDKSFTCRGCGCQFTGRKRIYCTKKCRSKHYDFLKYRKQGRKLQSEISSNAACNQTHHCFWCDLAFQPKRKGRDTFCSRECFFSFRKAKSQIISELTVSHRVWRNKCKQCGDRFDAKTKRGYCSSECEKVKQHEKLKNNYTAVFFSCKECGKAVTTSYGDTRTTYCSNACSRRYYRRIVRKMERARLRKVKVETVDPIKVFDRDAWKCQICGIKTPKTKRGTIKPNAPELDHIVPLSVGGEHSYRNTQCACRSCNAAKGSNVYGQIPMFAT